MADIYDTILDNAPSNNVAPEGESIYDKLLDQRIQNENENLMTSLGTAQKVNPDLAGEAQRLSQVTNIPPEIAQRNIEETRQRAKMLQAERLNLIKQSPILAMQLQDPSFAALAHDQLEPLTGVEKVFNWFGSPSDISKGYDIGQMQQDASVLKYKKRIGEITPEQSAKLGSLESQLKALTEGRPEPGVFGQTGEVIGQMSRTMPEAIKAGLWTATGAGAIGLAAGPLSPITVPAATIGGFFAGMSSKVLEQTFQTESAEVYEDMKASGVDEQTAQYASAGVGLVNGVLESANVSVLASPFKKALSKLATEEIATLLTKPSMKAALQDFAVSYGKAVASETATELSQEFTSIAGEEIAKQISKPEFESKLSTPEGQKEIAQRLGSVFEQTIKGMVFLAAPGPAINFRMDMKRVDDAKRDAQFIDALTQQSVDSVVRKRNPDAWESFIANQAENGPAKNFYIEAQQFQNVLNQQGLTKEQLSASLPDVASQVGIDVPLGGDVVIPTSVYAAKIAGTDFGNALKPHMRIDENGISITEALDIESQKEELKKNAQAVLEEKMARDQAFIDSAKDVEKQLFSQIKETGTYRDKVSKDFATFVRDFVVTQSADLGVLPSDFYEDYKLKIAKAQEQQDQFQQQEIINSLNPTGTTFTDYTPEVRASASLGQNMTTLDKTSGGNADDLITIYRGSPEGNIVAGDFVTTNEQLAKDYAGTGKVASLQVKKGDILDDLSDPLGEEYIYRPGASSEILQQESNILKQGAVKGKGGAVVGAEGAEAARKLRETVKSEGAQEIKDITADQVITDDRIPVITLQDLKDMRIFPTIADRTAAGVMYTGIDSSKLKVAIELLGGPFFPLRESNFEAGAVWANRGKEVMAAKGKKIASGADYMMVLMGDVNMHKSNTTVANVFFATLEAYVQDKRITKKNAIALTQLIKESVTKDTDVQKYIDKFPGLEDASKLEDYLHNISFTARARLIDILSSKAAFELGAPSMDKILNATREPSMAGHRWGDGVLVVKIDKEKPFLNLGEEGTRLHPDFPLGLRGEVIGKLATPLNYELLWQDWLANQKATKLAENPDAKINLRRAFELARPELEITQELIDRIGPIKSGNIDGSRQAVLAVDMALDRWRTSNETKNKGGVSPQGFVDAVAASPANVVLNEYKIEDVKTAIKDGSMRLYQLGDENSGIWFALKNGNPADDYGVQIEGLSDSDVTLTAVINNEQGARGIGGPAVVLKSLQQGATVLDCFAVKSTRYPEGFLPALYREFGFEIVGEIPFEPKYYSKQKLADAEKFWSESGWDKDQYGYPPVVIMKWSGTDEDRAGITGRYLRDGIAGVLSRGTNSATASVARLSSMDAGAQTTTAGTASDAKRAGGVERPVAQRSLASRAVSVARDIATLTDNEARNLGISTADRDAIARGFQSGGVFNQLGINEQQTTEGQFAQSSRGGFDPESLTILLTKKTADGKGADYSTFLHESAHFFLTAYSDLAAKPNATERMKADMQTLLDWFGVSDLETWNAMSLDQQRKYHEQFAYNFELYLFEGKAPSTKLQAIFDNFSRWLKRVYISIRDDLNALYREENGEDLPILTGEVRQVMDRMIASDEQIAQAEQINNMKGIYQSQELSGMDDNAWAAYQEMLKEARDAGVTELTKATLRQMKWLSDAQSHVLKEMQATANAQRSQVAAEVTDEVKRMPIYQAMSFIKRGELELPENATKEQRRFATESGMSGTKLSLPVLKEMYGEEANAAWRYLEVGKYGMVANEGLHPDLIASMFGFNSGDALVRALLEAKPMKEAIKERTDQRMLEEYSELSDPKAMEDEVQKALHNEARARFVAVELRYLAKATAPVRVMMNAAKQVAKQILSNKKLSEIKPREYTSAEARASKQAETFMKKGQSQEAQKAKQNQLVQNQLAAEALAAKAEVMKSLQSFKKVFKADDKLAKIRNMDLVNVCRSILSFYGIGAPKGKSPMEFVEKLRTYNAEMYAEIEPLILDAATGQKQFTDLTLDEFRSLRDTIESLWFQSRREHEIMIEGKLIDKQIAIDALNSRLEEIGIPEEIAGERMAPSNKERMFRSFNNTKAMLRRIEHWADATDGAAGVGPFTTYIFRPVSQALSKYRNLRNDYVKRYAESIATLSLPVAKIESPPSELNYTFGNNNGGIGKAELLGAMLHRGNASNFRKLLLAGRGGIPWGELNADGSLNASRWMAFEKRMQDEGILTKADYDWLQSVWDLCEEMKPLAQKAHHDIFGYYFKEIEYSPVVTPWGVYKGGYVPAKTDPFLVRDARINAKMDELEGDFRNSMPSTGYGFTKGRVEYNKPLSLDIRTMTKHIDDVIRFAMVQPAIKDVLSLIKSRSFADNLTRIDPSAIETMLLPWLNRAARNITTEAGMHKGIDKFWSGVRSRTGISIMFANITNALQQLTGYFPAMLKVDKTYLKESLVSYMSNTQKITEEVAEMSEFMKSRLSSQMFDIQDNMNELLLNPSNFDKIQTWSQHHGYFLQTSFQNQVDIVTWTATYNQTLAELGAGVDDKQANNEAIQRADAAVRLTQGSLSAEDIAAFEVGSPFYKTLIQFSGYFNMLANLNVNEYVKVFRDMGWKGNKGQLFMIYMLGFGLPMLISDAIVRSLGGQWDDEDDDGYTDEFMEWFFGSQIKGAVALVPFGTAAMAPFNAFNNKAYDDRITTSPSVSALESATIGVVKTGINIVEGKDVTGKNIRDTLTFLSLATGTPLTVLGRPIGYAVDVEHGKINPTSTVDFARGLITGKASEESKK